ncbi:MAG: metal ABC transporter permease [Actinobacteria bacterium]|nr:metal ABC transporter permease [Actinomycetota bacterium]
MLSYEFMQRALVAAVIVGLIAPLVGVHLVQRRLALLGDGMGHVALTGVGLALLLGTAPLATALVVALAGAVLIEFIRARSRAAADVALALLFYGGIAGGVLLGSLSGGSSASLNAFLFGSIATVTGSDVVVLLATAAVTALALWLFGAEMLAVSIDADAAAINGVRVRAISTLLSMLSAVTVVIGMRTVGLLLVSAIMIVPVAAAQQVAKSFRTTAAIAVGLGVMSSASGLVTGYYADVPPGPAIVLCALVTFIIAATVRAQRTHRATTRNGEVVANEQATDE